MRLVEADALELLRTLAAESVALIVTDPAYFFERASTHFKVFFPMLPNEVWPAVFGELYRVLVRDGHAYVFADARIKPIFDAAAEAAGFGIPTP